MLAVTVFETTSVTMEVTRQMMNMIAVGGKPFNAVSCSPIQSDRPDSLEASATANPPPIDQRTPQPIIIKVIYSVKT